MPRNPEQTPFDFDREARRAYEGLLKIRHEIVPERKTIEADITPLTQSAFTFEQPSPLPHAGSIYDYEGVRRNSRVDLHAGVPTDREKIDFLAAKLIQADKRATDAEHRADSENARATIAEARLAKAQTEISSLQIRVDRANGIIRNANATISELRSQLAQRNNNPHDPEGLFAALGFHPDAFRGLTDEQIDSIVKANYRVFAHRDHSDRGGDDQAMKKLNRARYILKDPEKRKAYINKTGPFDPRRK